MKEKIKNGIVLISCAVAILTLWYFIFSTILADFGINWAVEWEHIVMLFEVIKPVILILGGIIASLFIIAIAEDFYYDW